MSTNNTAAGWYRVRLSGVSIFTSSSTSCGGKNRAKFARCRSVSLRRSFAERFFMTRDVVMPIAARLTTARMGAVSRNPKPCTSTRLKSVSATHPVAAIKTPRRPR